MGLKDHNFRDLAENLRQMLSVAKEHPNLLVVKGTTNVIEEIGRTSLRVASLIHEYTGRKFISETVWLFIDQVLFKVGYITGRTFDSLFSDHMKFRIEEHQKSCNDLKEKFDRKVIMDTELQGDRIENGVKEVKMIQDDQLGSHEFRFYSDN